MDIHDLIDNFTRNFEGTDTKDFDDSFRILCLEHKITKSQFDKYKEDFRMFLYENPTFAYDGGGWERQYLLDNYIF